MGDVHWKLYSLNLLLSYNFEIAIILGTEVDATISKRESLAWKILQCDRGNRHGCGNLHAVEVLGLAMECYGNTEGTVTDCSWTESWNNGRWLGKASHEWDLALALKNKRQLNRHSYRKKFHVSSLFDALLKGRASVILAGRLYWCSITLKVKDFDTFSISASYLNLLPFVYPPCRQRSFGGGCCFSHS